MNCPYRARVVHNQRDGFMQVNGNHGAMANYEPNTVNQVREDPSKAWSKQTVSGQTGRYEYVHPNDNFE